MGRFILNPPKTMQVDHINGNRLDNRRSNLRICTQSQNCTSRKPWKENKTGYRGVNLLPSGKWRAAVKVNQKKIHLGVFDSPKLAARAYDMYAKTLHNEYAMLNFPLGPYKST